MPGTGEGRYRVLSLVPSLSWRVGRRAWESVGTQGVSGFQGSEWILSRWVRCC